MLRASNTNQDPINIIFFFVLLKLIIHLYTNAFAGYGIFRDELYLYACTLRLDLGYVDQPPLCVWVLKVFTMIFGKSVFAMRLAPALFGSVAIVPLGYAVRALGGKKIALIITLTAFVISPIYLAYCGYFSMNSIDLLLWNAIIFLVVKLRTTGHHIIWISLGTLMGLALMNKIGMLWFGLGFVLSLLLTRERHWFTTKWPYAAAGIALLIFFPYIIWNIAHDWATIEFLGSTGNKYRLTEYHDLFVRTATYK
jgi:4-amino-4-deoxy-L-arabinose transferase-like glycosyltransferase